jgi:hypothetical protein
VKCLARRTDGKYVALGLKQISAFFMTSDLVYVFHKTKSEVSCTQTYLSNINNIMKFTKSVRELAADIDAAPDNYDSNDEVSEKCLSVEAEFEAAGVLSATKVKVPRTGERMRTKVKVPRTGKRMRTKVKVPPKGERMWPSHWR